MPFADWFGGGRVVELTDGGFEEFLDGSRLAFVDFWASWCRPCRAMAPVVRSLAREYGDRVAFGKVNTEAEQGLAKRFTVRSIPMYMLFKRGRIVERFPGVASRDRLAAKIEKWL